MQNVCESSVAEMAPPLPDDEQLMNLMLSSKTIEGSWFKHITDPSRDSISPDRMIEENSVPIITMEEVLEVVMRGWLEREREVISHEYISRLPWDEISISLLVISIEELALIIMEERMRVADEVIENIEEDMGELRDIVNEASLSFFPFVVALKIEEDVEEVREGVKVGLVIPESGSMDTS